MLKDLYKKHEEIVNYLIVGVLTTLVAWAAKFLAAIFLDANIVWQNMVLSLINWTAGVIFAYFTNRKYVFKSTEENQIKEAAKFVASRISTLFLDMAVMFILVNLCGTLFVQTFGVTDRQVFIGATLFSAVLVTIANYIFSKLFVFNK